MRTVLVSAILVRLASAGTLLVPEDFTTLQEAITASAAVNDGDEHVGVAQREIPGLRRIDVRIHGTAGLSRIV